MSLYRIVYKLSLVTVYLDYRVMGEEGLDAVFRNSSKFGLVRKMLVRKKSPWSLTLTILTLTKHIT